MSHSVSCRSSARYFYVAILTVFFILPAYPDTLITPVDPRINYYGRFDFSDPVSPRWNWSGSAIEARFPGPYIGIGLIDGKADYDIEIDGTLDTVLRTVENVEKYIIGNSFSDDMHTIKIVQRSENHTSAASFKGFYLTDGKTLGEAPPKPSLKIEFIGNSDLVAYGVESKSKKCSDSKVREYTNTNKSFGALIARHFNAQSVILGWSGKGLVRNYDSPAKRSTTNFPAYYDRTLGMIEGKWDFTKWIPDLVVIILGWNDYSSGSSDKNIYPDDTMFIGDYHKFIGVIRGNYPDAAILCVTTHHANLVEYVKRVVEEETTVLGRQKIYFAEYPPEDRFELTGCNGHPSPKDHEMIAKTLIDTISKRMGWNTSINNNIQTTSIPYSVNLASGFKAYIRNGRIFVEAPDAGTQSDIIICNAQGKVVHRENLSYRKQFYVSASFIRPGVYIIGDKTIRWKQMPVMFTKN